MHPSTPYIHTLSRRWVKQMGVVVCGWGERCGVGGGVSVLVNGTGGWSRSVEKKVRCRTPLFGEGRCSEGEQQLTFTAILETGIRHVSRHVCGLRFWAWTMRLCVLSILSCRRHDGVAFIQRRARGESQNLWAVAIGTNVIIVWIFHGWWNSTEGGGPRWEWHRQSELMINGLVHRLPLVDGVCHHGRCSRTLGARATKRSCKNKHVGD